MDGAPFDGCCNDDHLGTSMPLRGAVHPITVIRKHNGLDPAADLRTVLAQIADHPAKKVADLLPWGDAFKAKTA
ncbi:transposase domain-containing protein [Rhodoblastus acidophilus]|uniref:Transposase domain-containing protein n=2 Tax=Candidatus Rhodoblastus alkanivorans TaxID=2954117 RepID=A0ABS9Z9G8_9HYPH|nr:transposase domain-containing protein [Candidatus Rhodoblastus alkanivorans]MCI4684274.1 transposase domain-containing protein [Candidatus Rhodoblastus alkanivorans]MDI4641594.1 transposase domain-containing protein [Rhodoblastus acidophilus]